MNLFLSSIKPIILLCSGILFTLTASAQTADSTIKELPINRPSGIVPSSASIQFAGSIGFLSLGAGWDYGKDKQWATEVLLGFVPKYDTDRNKITITLRQVYTPWEVPLKDKYAYHPLRTGLYLSTTVGKQFWFSAPEKYPNKYYTFSTKVRLNAFIGQDFSLNTQGSKLPFERVRFYYDLHTNDLYLINAVSNSYLKPKDYLGLALGLKMHFR